MTPSDFADPQAWRDRFSAVARVAAVEPSAPPSWAAREARARHVCRVIATLLDALEPGTRPRRELARVYARAFSLMVAARSRAAEELEPAESPAAD